MLFRSLIAAAVIAFSSVVSLAQGHVHLSYDASCAPTVLHGTTPVSTAGTTTGGIQEAIAYAETNHAALVGDGCADFVPVSSTIAIGSTRAQHYQFRGLLLRSSAAGPALKFDAPVFVRFDWSGHIEYVGGGDEVVLLDPHTQAPGIFGTAGGGRIHKFGHIHLPFLYVAGGEPTTVVRIKADGGSTVDKRIVIDGVHCGLIAKYGIELMNPVSNPSVSGSTAENFVDFGFIGACTEVGLKIGNSPIDHQVIPVNSTHWKGAINSDGPGKMRAYVETFAEHDFLDIRAMSINAGGAEYGVIFGASARGNVATMPQIQADYPVWFQAGSSHNQVTAPHMLAVVGPPINDGAASNLVNGAVFTPPANFEGTSGAPAGSTALGTFTYVDRSWQIDNGKTATKLWLNTTTAGTYPLKLVRRDPNVPNIYDVVASQSITHGGSGLESITLGSAYAVANDGLEYFVGVYTTGANHPTLDNKARSYIAADATGNGVTMTEQAAQSGWHVLAVGVTYQ